MCLIPSPTASECFDWLKPVTWFFHVYTISFMVTCFLSTNENTNFRGRVVLVASHVEFWK